MKYSFGKFEVYYVNDKYETKLLSDYDTFNDAEKDIANLIEHAVYIYGVVDKNTKVLLYKEESEWISKMYYITNNFVEF